jgi:hypothetical protein
MQSSMMPQLMMCTVPYVLQLPTWLMLGFGGVNLVNQLDDDEGTRP